MQMDTDEKVCRCNGARTHCYDVARSGYLNLTLPGGGEGDSKAAVQARKSFLSAGYYAPLCDLLDEMLSACNAKSVLDAGSGEGYYTNRLASGRDVLGVDLSRAGVDSAAKYAKQTGSGAAFAVGSIFSLPVVDESFDALINLFAPCAESEFLRVLKPMGHLLVVGEGERHLFGLKEILYENPYLNPGRADLPTDMKQIDRRRLTYRIEVEGREQIEALFSMTPYYWRTSLSDRQKLAALDALTTEIEFDCRVYIKQ
jgi:23S rRNA (guanine745-N1)-methyltransferase